jgi:hypothetical protein
MRTDSSRGIRHWRPPLWLARGLCAVALLEATGVTVIVRRTSPDHPGSLYRTLSQEATPSAGTIRVVPDPSMALTDWNALLHVLHLRVVGGPDPTGAYIVAPTGGATTQHVLQQLRAIRGVRRAQAVTETP